MENQFYICELCDTIFQQTDDIHNELCMDCCNNVFGQHEERLLVFDYIPELEVIRANREKNLRANKEKN